MIITKFTPTEQKIVNLIVDGYTNNEIANALNITTHTVKTHIENIYRKYEVHNKVGLVVKLYKLGLINIK